MSKKMRAVWLRWGAWCETHWRHLLVILAVEVTMVALWIGMPLWPFVALASALGITLLIITIKG